VIAAPVRRVLRLAVAGAAVVLCACGGAGSGGGGGGGGGGLVVTAQQVYDVDRLNVYRFMVGVGPVAMDAQLNDFAIEGSQELLSNHVPHGHFDDAAAAGTLFTTDGFVGSAAENQGDPFGWPPNSSVEA
jgi:hypothetical protein